jgi:hypothetical protein
VLLTSFLLSSYFFCSLSLHFLPQPHALVPILTLPLLPNVTLAPFPNAISL